MSPLRKLMHLAITLVPAAGWLVSFWLALALAGAMMVASLAVEIARRCWPRVNDFLWRLLPSVFREWEDRRVLGSTWFAMGTLVTLLVCGRDVGGTAVLFVAWGDSAGEIAGHQWGRPGQSKTLAGTVGCLAGCLLAAAAGIYLGGLNPLTALVGSVAATLVERWSPPPDDNLWMPILSGLAMLLVQQLTGG